MKELWTTNPFRLVNGPFAEMSYNSSGPNITPTHLLLAMHAPLAGPPRVIRSLPAQHPLTQTDALIPLCAQAVGITGGGLLVSALLTLCSPSACFPRNIRRLPACHLPAGSPQTTCQHTAQHLLSLCNTQHGIWWLPASHLPMPPCTTIRWSPAQHPPSHRKPSTIALHTIL